MGSGPNDGVFVIRRGDDQPLYCTLEGAKEFLSKHEPAFDWFAFHEAFLATAWEDGTRWQCGEYTVELRYIPCGGEGNGPDVAQ